MRSLSNTIPLLPTVMVVVVVVLVVSSCVTVVKAGTWTPMPCCTPPTGLWCDYQQLPTEVPFSVMQESWTTEYFLFSANSTTTIGFKLYAGMASAESFSVIVAENYCPNWGDVTKLNLPFVFSYGTASIEVNVTEGSNYVIFAHMSGNNYTLAACDGPCPQACPNDCTNILQGICDVAHSTCMCYSGWTGPDCSQVANTTNGTVVTPPHHHKVPFGSEAVFIFVIAGLPTAVVITAVTGTLLYLAYRKKEAQMKRKEKQPLINPSSPSSNGTMNGHHHFHLNNHHHNGHGKDNDMYSDSVSLSPAFPPSPQYDRAPSPTAAIAPSTPIPDPSAPPLHRSPEEQQNLHRRNNNKN